MLEQAASMLGVAAGLPAYAWLVAPLLVLSTIGLWALQPVSRAWLCLALMLSSAAIVVQAGKADDLRAQVASAEAHRAAALAQAALAAESAEAYRAESLRMMREQSARLDAVTRQLAQMRLANRIARN